MKKFAVAALPFLTLAVMAAPAPRAHAGPDDWYGDSPRGGMVVVEGGGRLPVHAEVHPAGDHSQMTAANGCVEEWYNQSTASNSTSGNGLTTGFIGIHVTSGEGPGCRSQENVLAMIQDLGGGKRQATVTEARPEVASFVLFNNG